MTFGRSVSLISTLLFATQLTAAVPSTNAICTRVDRFSLSIAGAAVLNGIETDAEAIAKSPVPLSKILSTCNRFVSASVDGPAIFSAARDMIALADHEVDIAFYHWDPATDAARLIGDGLIAAQARRTPSNPLLVRMILDDVEDLSLGRPINNLYDSQKDWVTRGLDLSRVQIQLGTCPRATGLSPNLHDKVIVVDAKYVFVTGANVEAAHNAGSPWHDTGYVVEGDAAQSALADFEHTWVNDAFHWECQPETMSNDCDKRSSHFPQPVRTWLPAFGAQRPGDIPVLAVGRNKGSASGPDLSSPQNLAWTTLMDRATSEVHIETPNINDSASQSAILRAIGRGVTVKLITSLGFNDFTDDLIGGDNLEIAGNLRNAIRTTYPSYVNRFQLRWYSKNGIEPVEGNVGFASHTKYMTANGVAVVGSGNQDAASWLISHEFNLLIDDAPVTTMLENAIFVPDWNKAITNYAEIYEGNNGTQDVICAIGLNQSKNMRFFDGFLGPSYPCDNDEARSLLLHDVPAGKVLRFYDDGNRLYQEDDWTEIVVKRALSRKYINTFEQSFEDADVKVTYHHDNGLDGKITGAEIASSPVGAVMDLYEGNNASQTLVCSNRTPGTRTIDLTSDAYCNNDEARSLVLTDFPTDMVVFVYDHSGGSTGDDWALIVPKRPIARAVVPSFETSFENADVRVCVFYDNGLDGKVSRIRVGALTEAIGKCGVTAPPPAGCTEPVCVPAQGTYISHFSAPNCGGTESYYLPYDGFTYNCRTWNGTGQCGTIQRTVTNYSSRMNNGPCQNLWPSGNTLSQFVTVYRGQSYALSVTRSGGGSGSVTSVPAGINCGSSCSANFSSGTAVTLTASASTGSTFTGWSDACSGTGSCTTTMSQARSVTATFSVAGCGEATCVPSQGMYISHFSAPGCTGTESYYLPYDGFGYNCRTWNGTGQCGTTQRTVTNYSVRVNGGACQDSWPSGNTLSQFVTIYR